MDNSSSFVPLRKKKKKEENTTEPKVITRPSIHGDSLRSQFRLEVDGIDIPDPVQSFEEMSLPSRTLTYLKRTKHFSKPTPIQMQAISCLIKSRDVICLSPTGSGKTYGYLLPLCSFLWKRRDSLNTFVNPQCLILVPTRELMRQVCDLTKELMESLNLFTETQNLMTSRNGDNNFHREWNRPQQYQTWNPSYQQQQPRNPFYQQSYGNHLPANISNYTLNDYSMYQQQLPRGDSFRQQFPHGDSFGHSSQPPPFNNQGNIMQNPFMLPPSYHEHTPRPPITGNNKPTSAVIGLCGGVPINEDLKKLSPKTMVVISTPGRLLDLCERGKINLDQIGYFVIDECDRSLEMGMEEQLRKIVAMVTVNEKTCLQTSLWSATLPESLERLARSAVVDPVYICAGIKDTVPVNITQTVLFVHTYQKEKALLEILRKTPYPPVIVFTSSKDKADQVTQLLQKEQFQAAAMHSGKDQHYRNDVMEDFRENRIDVLVATDLISRGLDIPTVTHVIHYDTPDTIEDYIHRSGRTGRFGRQGHSSTLLTLDCKIAVELKELLEMSHVEIPLELRDTKMFGKKVIHTDMGDRIV